MKQLALQGVTPFPPAPIDAPHSLVLSCETEAEAVRWCLDYARIHHALSLRAVARLCGWKRASFLSEIASEASGKSMPAKRIRLFTLATGCRLVEQYHERKATERQLAGKQTDADRRRLAVAALIAQQQPAFERRAVA